MTDSLKALAIIPVRESDLFRDGQPVELAGKPLLSYTLEAARAAARLDRIIVTTDSERVRSLALSLGGEAPFLRPSSLASPDTPLDYVLRHTVEWLEKEESYRPDVVVLLEAAHPLRPEGLIDEALETMAAQGLDTIFTVCEESHVFWSVDEEGNLSRLGGGELETRATRSPLYREVSGLFLATRTPFILQGKRFGDKVGVVPIRSPYGAVDTQDPWGLEFAGAIARGSVVR